MSPQTRKKLAGLHFIGSIIAGILCTILLARDPYERVLLGISFYAITITAWDVYATTDVRAEQEDE